jgi:hypothetical protein
MIGHAAFVRTVPALAVVSTLSIFSLSAPAFEATVARTNLVERWITNVIEVRMPLNRFVDEYHTNWVTEFRTNLVNVYATNRVTRTVTNQFLVDVFHTNFVTAYQTNWQTVVVITTNWVTQAATNSVQVDVPSPSIATESAREVEAPKVEAAASASAAAPNGPFLIEASRTAQPPRNGQVEVQLKVKGNGDSAAAFQVQQWKVERQDRAILCFGQEQEFKRELPAGKYKVEVKVRLDADGPLLAARGTMVVTPGEAHIEQNLAATR